MRKLFLITLMVALGVISKAQTAFNQTATNPTGSYSDTGSDTMTYALTRSFATVSIQPLVTKVSGTIAGTLSLYTSVDGVNYVAYGSALTLTNISKNSTIWDLRTAARYFRIISTGGTTLSATASAKISVVQ